MVMFHGFHGGRITKKAGVSHHFGNICGPFSRPILGPQLNICNSSPQPLETPPNLKGLFRVYTVVKVDGGTPQKGCGDL